MVTGQTPGGAAQERLLDAPHKIGFLSRYLYSLKKAAEEEEEDDDEREKAGRGYILRVGSVPD